MSASRFGEGFAQGRIVAIQGLDQEIARQLNQAQLKMLGVGAQLGRGKLARGFKILDLGADGSVKQRKRYE